MAKSLIFLFDGTANDATADTFSNVYRINQLIAASKKYTKDGVSKHKTQVTFYLPGIGTKFTVWRPKKSEGFFAARGDRVRQQIFGDNLEQVILRAYINLSANFREGDNIVLIGFSRGAAAARIFSRLISDFGVLQSERLSLLDRMWNEFVRISELKADNDYYEEIRILKENFKPAGSIDSVFHPDHSVTISFMGLFDTVIGKLDDDIPKSLEFRDEYPAKKVENIVHLLSMHDVRGEYLYKRFQPRNNAENFVREIWVPGVHSDVGGGYQDDFISSVSLLTMCDFMRNMGGIAVDDKAYQKVVTRIKDRIRDERIVINPEPFVSLRRSRYSGIYDIDELHPLHYHLTDKNVYWKNVRQTTVYENRLRHNHNVADPKLKQAFLRWIS